MSRITPAAERFWKFVEVGDCWIWTGSRVPGGYGQFNRGDGSDVPVRAHRWAWEHLVGPIPDGLHLDHLCRNPPCVNPDHLEPVTPGENMRRGAHPSALTRRTGVCRRGHVLSEVGTLPISSTSETCAACRTTWRRTSDTAARRAAGARPRLTAEQVREIRAAHAAGVSSGDLALQHDRTPQNIWLIVTGQIWKDVS